MRIFSLLAREAARLDERLTRVGFDQAVGRVREALLACGPARLDVANNGLGRALSSLGSELRSDAIPERLRDAAARLAGLLGAGVAPSPAPVVALEDALAKKDASPVREGASLLQDHAAHMSGREGVCPFTGMRADGTLTAPPPEGAGPSAPTLKIDHELASDTSVAARTVAHEVSAEASSASPAHARKPRARVQPEQSTERVEAREPKVEARGSAREPKIEAAVRAAKPREKNKERLAGARAVENTSARSATRSTAKQPRGRTQASRKKA